MCSPHSKPAHTVCGENSGSLLCSCAAGTRQADRESLGLLDDVVEDQRAPKFSSAPQRRHPTPRAPTATLAPRGLGLDEQIQRRHEHQHTSRVELLRAAHGDEWLAGPGCPDHLRPQPPPGHKSSCRQFEGAEYRVHGLALVSTQSLRPAASSHGAAVGSAVWSSSELGLAVPSEAVSPLA